VRWIGIVGVLAALVSGSAAATDGDSQCLGARDEDNGADAALEPTQPLLTENQCESLKTRELRVLLLEVPQEEEDPMQLSLGVKNGGAALRLKIPFSF
jgi:hypothetical protein